MHGFIGILGFLEVWVHMKLEFAWENYELLCQKKREVKILLKEILLKTLTLYTDKFASWKKSKLENKDFDTHSISS